MTKSVEVEIKILGQTVTREEAKAIHRELGRVLGLDNLSIPHFDKWQNPYLSPRIPYQEGPYKDSWRPGQTWCGLLPNPNTVGWSSGQASSTGPPIVTYNIK